MAQILRNDLVKADHDIEILLLEIKVCLERRFLLALPLISQLRLEARQFELIDRMPGQEPIDNEGKDDESDEEGDDAARP